MTASTNEDDEGVGCRPALETMLIFVAVYLLAALVFFTGDPEAMPFWRLWVFSSAAPVSGVIMSFGGGGLVWTLDGALWFGIAFWVARAEQRPAWRRRLGVVAVAAITLGAITASAG